MTHQKDLALILGDFPVDEVDRSFVGETADSWQVREALRQLHEFDLATFKHVIQVGILASHLAREDGLTIEQNRLITVGALVHDVGKVGVDKDIVDPPKNSDAKFSRVQGSPDRRFAAIQFHSEIGFRMVRLLMRDEVDPETRNLVPPLVLTHHCYNEARTQYPDESTLADLVEEGVLARQELENPALLQLAGYLGLADVYEAITAGRKYITNGEFDEPEQVRQALAESYPDMGVQIDRLMSLHDRRINTSYQTV